MLKSDELLKLAGRVGGWAFWPASPGTSITASIPVRTPEALRFTEPVTSRIATSSLSVMPSIITRARVAPWDSARSAAAERRFIWSSERLTPALRAMVTSRPLESWPALAWLRILAKSSEPGAEAFAWDTGARPGTAWAPSRRSRSVPVDVMAPPPARWKGFRRPSSRGFARRIRGSARRRSRFATRS
jgi:hypothetical protein